MKAYHGNILTVDSNDSIASWLVEDAERITYVGNERPGGIDSSDVVELGNRALVPSFADTHEHLASFATFNAGLNVMHAMSNVEICQMVEDFHASCHDKILIAFGASPYSVVEGHLVTRAELDEACPDKPACVIKYDGHACVVNTKMLDLVRKDIEDQRGYHPETGEMNQEAFFKVSDTITNSIPIPGLIRNIQRAMDYLAARGIGMVHTVSGVGFPGDMDISLETWLARSAESGFQIRVFPQSLDIASAQKRGLPRIGGCFACALDGCFGSTDAALNAPYEPGSADGLEHESGVLYYPDEKVAEFCRAANRAGLQIELHAIGDAAFDQATRCIKAALDDYPRDNHRHGIIHACLPTDKGIAICAQYGIQLPMQTSFIDWPQEPDAYLEQILGARAERLNPLRTLFDAGIVMSAGSDAPCTDPNPILWMQRACNHSVESQSLTVQEALRMCTYNGYWTTFDEGERGSLEVGKVADMCILSENPYDIDVSRLGEVKVEQLLLGGKPYEKQRAGFIGAVLKGMVSKRKA